MRNKVAHIGGNDFSDADTWRALDTMARLCEAFDDEAAEEIRAILRESRYGSSDGSTTIVENKGGRDYATGEEGWAVYQLQNPPRPL